MEQRVDLLTLGVPDIEVATRYYVDGLGWEPMLVVPGEVTFLRAGHSRVVALFGADDLATDAGQPMAVPISIGQLVGSEAEVDAVVGEMVAAGATLVKEPQRAEWGGYHAYVADPSGFCWEIAHNPGWSVDADGTVTIGAVDG